MHDKQSTPSTTDATARAERQQAIAERIRQCLSYSTRLVDDAERGRVDESLLDFRTLAAAVASHVLWDALAQVRQVAVLEHGAPTIDGAPAKWAASPRELAAERLALSFDERLAKLETINRLELVDLLELGRRQAVAMETVANVLSQSNLDAFCSFVEGLAPAYADAEEIASRMRVHFGGGR